MSREAWEIEDGQTIDLVATLVKLKDMAADHGSVAQRRRYYSEIANHAQYLCDYAAGVASELEDPRTGGAE